MSSSLVNEFTDANFQSEVMTSSLPVLVDMWAPWCGPCRMLGPIFEELATELQGKVKFGKLNVDDNPQTTQTYEAHSIPTILFIKNGEIKHRHTGLLTKDKLKSKIQSNLLE